MLNDIVLPIKESSSDIKRALRRFGIPKTLTNKELEWLVETCNTILTND